MQRTFTLSEIDPFSSDLLQYLEGCNCRVIALHGEMGAGKTTLVSALLRSMGSTDHASSPTFSIINQYTDAAGNPVYHMDWYRLRDEEEALNAGVEDPLYSGHWCLVEWPEKAASLLPEDTMHLYISTKGESTRHVSITG